MINDRTGALKAALNQNDGYEPCNDVNITIDNPESSMAEFFSEIEEVSQYLSKIESSVEEVKKKHSAVLCAPQSDEKVKQEIESLTAEIKRLANKVRGKLKLMEHGADIEKDKNSTSATYRIKMTQHSTLSRRFVDIMFQYNKIQTDHRERCKDRIKRQLEITGKVTTDEEIENMLEKGDPAIFIEGIVIETQKAKQTLADIEARHADIMKLEKSIRELHDMFMDMAVLVESQGELINRIEHNVQNSVDFVDHAKGDINRAVKYQSKARRVS